MKWLSFRFILYGIFSIPYFSFSQNLNLPLNQCFNAAFDQSSISSKKVVHDGVKPVLEREALKADTPHKNIAPSLFSPERNDKSFVSRKLFYEHLITLDTGSIHLTIDPLFNLELGNQLQSDPRGNDLNYYKNMRGFNIKLDLGEKVSFESSFRENQAVLPYYLDQRAASSKVAYGQGRWKTFGDNGYDFSMASAYISYSPQDWVNIQAGHGKHFIGYGHRSMLLSDLSFNYPFLRINSSWFNNKLNYQNLFSIYQDLNRLGFNQGSEGLFERKQAAAHYLEYSPTNRFSFAVFESTIFPSIDTSGNINVGANYWVPIIGLNSTLESNEEMVNSVFGTNLKWNLLNNLQAYQQLLFSSSAAQYLGSQFGLKYFPVENLLIQLEGNHSKIESNNNLFSHYNESLTVPRLDETMEFICILQYQKNRWITRLSGSYFDNDNASFNNQVLYFDFNQSFIVNPSNHFTLSIGIQNRDSETNSLNPVVNVNNQSSTLFNDNSTYVYFGLSTNLQNLYFNY